MLRECYRYVKKWLTRLACKLPSSGDLFESVPIGENVFGGLERPAFQEAAVFSAVAENVRVAERQLSDERANDMVDCEAAFFLGDLRVENHLQKEIAQFFLHVGIVLFANRGLKLLGFFEQIFEEC